MRHHLESKVHTCRILEKMNRSRAYSAVLKSEDKSIDNSDRKEQRKWNTEDLGIPM